LWETEKRTVEGLIDISAGRSRGKGKTNERQGPRGNKMVKLFFRVWGGVGGWGVRWEGG